MGLASVLQDGAVPAGYGFIEGEAGYGEWNPIEKLTVGRKAGKQNFKAVLPRGGVWEVRARLWVQALEGMIRSTR